ncbi:MAG: hypothetical protein HY247_00435 [archaeon]|nr:MAG: hypothetical protein HY247_00435 [archaeon]
MRLFAVEAEANCVRTHEHAPRCDGGRLVCYRCGLIMGACSSPSLGSLLDY